MDYHMYIHSKKEKKKQKRIKRKKRKKKEKKEKEKRRRNVYLCIVSSSIKFLYRLLSVIYWVVLLLGIYVRFFLMRVFIPWATFVMHFEY